MHLITTHTQADFDALASMLALKKLYPDAVLAFSGSQEANVSEYFASGALAGYTFFSPDDIDIAKVSVLSIVDTRTSRNIGPFAKCFKKNIEINIFDHHPQTSSDIKGKVELVKDYGATTTLLVELLQEKGLTLSAEEATTLALGIYDDTGAMSHLTTTPADLSAAAWLLEQGAQLEIVNRFLRRELTRTQVEILHEILNTAQRYSIHDITVVLLTWSGEEYIDDFPRLVRRFMIMENIDHVCALFSMAGRLYLVVRSNTEYLNAGEIIQHFGGSGHSKDGMAIIRDITLVQAQEQLVNVLHQYIQPPPKAKEIMSSPAITIASGSSIDQAHDLLVRYNITAAPVVSENRTEGIISRQIVERASHHHLGKRPVEEYMSSDFASLEPTATLADIQEIIIKNQQRRSWLNVY